MKLVCASCGKEIGESPATGYPKGTVSHGMCEFCAKHFLAQIGMPLEEYLDGLEAPTVCVAPNGTIATASRKASEMLGKPALQIQGYAGGEVFECKYARLPEGCGNTIHCSGCTIRKTVMDTLETGTPHHRVPACLERHADDGPKRISLLISTERIGGVVFLEVDSIAEAEPEPDS
ncbi:hypothetical protein JW916_00690 [Candidatus Sumerlaeota bacterium]|nr:hypothetical protein [Candidatus Sumerlaeota bacterium]